MADQVSEALAVLAGLVLADGRRWGDAATPVQWGDAQAVLDVTGPRRHWLGRSRGYSKTTDVGGLTIAAMLTQLPGSATGYAAAADKDQARLVVDALRGFVARTPELRGALEVHTHRVTATRRGVVLEVLAADAASAYGLLPAWLVVDELCQWNATANARTFYEALTTGLPKVSGSRQVVMTTAGDPAHWSRKVYQRATASRLWRVSEVHGPAPWQDAAELEEERARLLPSSYARLFENRWTASEDRLVDPEDLDAALTLAEPLPAQPGRQYVITVDLGLKNDRTVVSVCHGEREDPHGFGPAVRLVCDRMDVWQGSRQAPVELQAIEDHLVRLATSYAPCRVLVDPYQAVGLIQRLGARQVRAEEFVFSAQSVGRVAHALFTVLKHRRATLPNVDALREELLNVRLRETSPGVYRLDHDSGRHDDRAITLGMAAASLLGEQRGPDLGAWLSQAAAVRRIPPMVAGLDLKGWASR